MKRLQSPIAKKVNLICFLKKYNSFKNDSTKQTQLQIQKCFNNTVTILNKNKKFTHSASNTGSTQNVVLIYSALTIKMARTQNNTASNFDNTGTT